MTPNQTQGTCFFLARIDSSAKPRVRRLRFGLLLCTAISPVGVFAQNLPVGGVVAAGSAAISSDAGTMVVTQSSNNAIVNWQDFSIGAENSVTFRQPDRSSTTLNRVNGAMPSQIDGSLSANGSVFLINPNGVIIGPGGTVRTGSFLASSLNVSDQDFLQGHFSFEGNGASASVENHGEITSLSGGFVALLGGSVKNSGTIAVPLGRVGFGAGERITLDFGGDGFLQVAVPSASDTDDALVEHSGTITADGGTVIMSAATARNAVRNAINLSGVVEARSVSGRNGHVRLGGGSGGTVKLSGRIDTRAPDLDLRGGEVVLTGAGLFVMPQAVIDASGGAGGGVVRIGGGWQGGEDLPWAYATVLENGAEVRADGLSFGDGGSIALWSENATYFAGDISASGGQDGGNGGEVEVSSTGRLVLKGDVDLSAPQGDSGALLLDPIDIEVVADGTTDDVFTGVPSIDNFSVTFNPRVIFGTSSETPSTIEAGQLVEYLLGGDVTLQAADDGLEDSIEEGNITISAPLSWSTETTLLLDALNDITINAPIDAAAGGLQFDTFGDITTGAAGSIDVDQFRVIRGNWRQISETLPSFAANVFTSGDADGNRSFLRALGGDGSAGNPYLITDIYGLQGIDSDVLLDQHFALANSIDASGTARWTSTTNLPGTFQRIGRYFAATPAAGEAISPFTGSIDGRGHTISNLTIDREGYDGVGFIALNEGTVRNLNFTNADITGWNSVGTVAGINDGTILDVSVNGNVNAVGGSVGGLAGQNFDEITSSSFDGTVTGSTGDIGGAVGFNGQDAVMSQVSSSGAVNLDLAPGDSDTSLLYRQDFEEPRGFENQGSDVSRTVPISDYYGTPSDSNDLQRFNFAGAVTIETINITGSQRGDANPAFGDGYRDASGQGGDFAVGMVETETQSDVLGLSFEAGDQRYLTISIDVSSIDLTSVHGGPYISDDFPAPEFRVSLFDNPSGASLTRGRDEDLLGSQIVRGTGSAGDLFEWTTEAVTFDRNSATSDNVLFQFELLNGGYGAIDNLVIESTDGGSALRDVHIGGLLGRNAGGGTPGLVEFGQSSASVSARVSDDFNAEMPGIDTFAMNTGGLIGSNDGDVRASRSTGDVAGDWGNIGGFVGTNDGSVVNSYSQASLRTGNPDLSYERDLSAGGFAGWNNAAISQVFSSGDVLIGDVADDNAPGTGVEVRVGGLLGTNQSDGRISDAYTWSSLDVAYESAASDVAVGGFAGANEGSIERAYAAAPIAGADSATLDAFAGTQGGTVSDVFWDATLAGEISSGSGFGLPSETFQETNSFIDEAVGWDFETVWAPPKPGAYPRQYPTSPVIYVVPDDVTAEAGDDYELTFTQFGGPDVYLFDDLDNAVSGITLSPSDASGAGTYDIVASDDVGSSDDTTFDIVVASASLTLNEVDTGDVGNVDQAPTFDPDLAVVTTPNATTVTFNVFAAVSDPDSDELTIDGTPLDTSNGEVSVAPDGVVTFTPNEGVVGDVVLNFDVSDGTTAITVPFTVTVQPASSAGPPIANPPGPQEDLERTVEPPIINVAQPPEVTDTISNLPSLALDTPSEDQGAVAGAVAVSPEAAEETETATRAVSGGFDVAVASCRQDEDIATVDSLACVSEALANYASALEELEQEFSESLQGVSAIIRDARVGVDDVIARAENRLAAASTDAERAAINAQALSEAQDVIATAQARIREAVTLAKADDPVIERLQVAQGGVVLAALETTNVELARATGL